MTIDRLYQCDPAGAASNSNFAGIPLGENAMAPSHVNNAFRQLALMLAHEFHLPPAQISASVSCNIVTSTVGQHCIILGAGAINSFGTIPGEHADSTVWRILEFSSSASLSHGPALRLIGGASRRTQPGDIGAYLHVGGSDSWIETFYSRADGTLAADSISVTTITGRSMSTSAISTLTLNAASASVTSIGIAALNSVNSISASVGNFTILKVGGHGTIAQVVRDTEAAYTTCSTSLPVDNSIPQNTEGNEVLSVAITPVNASSILHVRAVLNIGASTTMNVGAALFVDTTANALAAISQRVEGATAMYSVPLEYTASAASTSARTYRIRVGPNTTGDAFLNGDGGGRQFGGVAVSRLEVTEILPQ